MFHYEVFFFIISKTHFLLVDQNLQIRVCFGKLLVKVLNAGNESCFSLLQLKVRKKDLGASSAYKSFHGVLKLKSVAFCFREETDQKTEQNCALPVRIFTLIALTELHNYTTSIN